MAYICKYNNYIKEELDEDFDFKIGDEVIVSGMVDDRYFDDIEAVIIKIENTARIGTVKTNKSEEGDVEQYNYNGTIYKIGPKRGQDWFESWWVAPYNIELKHKRENIGKIKWYYKGKLDESVSIYDFKIGDKVIVNGEIDRREYIDEPGEIYDIDRDGYVRTNIHSDGKGEFYDYRGKIYCIHFPDEKDDDYSEWWVSPYNISVEKKDIGKIKWYHKGKLEESVHCAADLIGKRVTFVGDQSLVLDYGDEGTVQDIVSINLVKVHWDKYISKSINGHSWNVNTNYLDLCETEEMGEIKWYYKGKLNK